ncbi:ceramide-1-phosphate transfer protein [Teleopsis dalmanni]|uniref:ceramide-1-phosphate transfer protein n=1 Tax=Teleopsis dalmanni TaxID=139649 RepID=UPI000D3298BA|nr:ceramide-1-phosphate transfer protein [Teleopsis dalmanni]XP_037948757.1 ceramide-1-phosphate transfer protein [Teleopsis dalmanni]
MSERFDIEKVGQTFQDSLHGEDDIHLGEYLQAYEEINKFFQLMGSVFGFVSSDVRSKIDILEEFRSNDGTTTNFKTIKTMIEYEINTDLLKDKNYISGSRTLLRLHRGLEFVYEFLNRLSELEEHDKLHNCSKEVYNDTLGKHHPWMIRKGAVLAMYALPTQGELLKRVCVNVPRAKEVLPDMLKNTKTVYERTDSLYTHFDLHGLP